MLHNFVFVNKIQTMRRFFLKQLILFILFYINIQNGYCEKNFEFKNLSTEQGLPGVSVRRIYQDSKGIMWFCIESVGVCSYDGNNYTQFEYSEKDTSSLSNNFATAVTEDKTGNIWIGTINGLNILNPGTHKIQRIFHSNKNNNSIVDNNITDLLTDNLGNIWISTTNGLSIYIPSENKFYRVLSTCKNNTNISRIYKSSKGNIYIGTLQSGLYVYSEKDIEEYLKKIKSNQKNSTFCLPYSSHYLNVIIDDVHIKINNIRCFAEENDSTILISLNCGTCRYNPKNEKFNRFYFEDSDMRKLNSFTFLDMLLDKNQNLWLITYNKGLYVYNLKSKKVSSSIDQPELFSNFSGYETRDLYQDNSGLIWITTKFNGLYTYDRRQENYMHIKVRKTKNGINTNSYVLSLLNTNDNDIWVGSKRDGLFLYDILNNQINDKNIPLQKIQSILEEDNSHLWLGTLDGLAKYNIKTNSYKIIDNSIITALCKNKDVLWVASFDGFKWYSTTKNMFFHYKTKHENFFKNTNIKTDKIINGKKNTLWIATNENGLYRYQIDTDSLTRYVHYAEDSLSISGDMPRALFYDKNGIFWVGCKSAGLNMYDEENDCFITPSKIPGLLNSSIYNIMEDENNNLWMGTHNGIVKYNIINGILEEYSLDCGLQGKVFELNAYCKTKDGELYMGGQNGFNRFRPSQIHKHKGVAPIIISDFKVYDTKIDGNINTFKKYKLSENSKYISISFSLLEYNSIGKNEYAYKLDPIDKDWVYCGKRNIATYTNLAGGDYTFSVKGANGDGIWNKEPIRIQFNIKTPLVAKTSFRISVIILALVLLTIYIFKKAKATQRKEKTLLKLVEERTTKLRYANKELIEKSEQITLQNEELIKHRENLEEIVKSRTHDLKLSKEKAEESDRLKSAFLANMSHEIRTPLNAILGFSSLIATSEFEPEYLNGMNDIIQSNGNSLLQIINDIIDISMIEANQLEIIKTEFDLNSILKELYTNIQQQNLLFHKQKEIEIELELDPLYKSTPFMIFSDKERVKQIIMNLVSNAFKFTDSGYIKFGYSVLSNKNELLFFVEDSGIGMEQKDLDKIFIRFQKIESKTNTIHRGTGLGLSICKNLVYLLGGNITVTSKSNIGTKFLFTIPYK